MADAVEDDLGDAALAFLALVSGFVVDRLREAGQRRGAGGGVGSDQRERRGGGAGGGGDGNLAVDFDRFFGRDRLDGHVGNGQWSDGGGDRVGRAAIEVRRGGDDAGHCRGTENKHCRRDRSLARIGAR